MMVLTLSKICNTRQQILEEKNFYFHLDNLDKNLGKIFKGIKYEFKSDLLSKTIKNGE